MWNNQKGEDRVMSSELPKDLQEAQARITAWHKEDQLKQLIGKFYVAYTGTGPPTALRRIYLDKDNKIRVEEYDIVRVDYGAIEQFKWITYTIEDPILRYSESKRFSEIEGKVWYQCLERVLNLEALKPANMKLMKKQEVTT